MENLLGGPQNIIATDSLFTAAGLSTNALVIDTSPDNFELLIGKDYDTIGPDKLPGEDIYKGKVRTALAPAIYRPTGICEITSLT